VVDVGSVGWFLKECLLLGIRASVMEDEEAFDRANALIEYQCWV